MSGLSGVNIARDGNVMQSSQYEDGVPERAIDGNRTSLWVQRSCTHTNNDIDPWWRLDLQKSYKISTITITNRKDCCYERLSGAEIRIGNSLKDCGNANPRCTVIGSIGPGVSKTFYCRGLEGRYINIVIPGRREYLTLCEVEVTGTPSDDPTENLCSIMTPAVVFVLLAVLGQMSGLSGVNIAKDGKVTQSSQYEDGVPERAIDGNRASLWVQRSCTHTNNDMDPWWRLDLRKSYKISTITITNRKDCCYERLSGAEIRIGNSLKDSGNANPRCTVIGSIRPGVSKTFYCRGLEGRYINIVIPGRREYLTLCEVEVTGTPSDDPTEYSCD
ncbi:hypothetical protein L3Q82_013064 [Scortum barcoo]|uniref:Uncharacterized protein n=1 Tax=Scortum barcoo TaxID=214431 RepID=A0ACB8VZC6_9TELE|nr:hypothetical protein L3Q82_013064 [Scortum barcoo]